MILVHFFTESAKHYINDFWKIYALSKAQFIWIFFQKHDMNIAIRLLVGIVFLLVVFSWVCIGTSWRWYEFANFGTIWQW